MATRLGRFYLLPGLLLGLLVLSSTSLADSRVEREAQVAYLKHVASTHQLLGFSVEVAQRSRLELQFEPQQLVPVGRGLYGRLHFLAPEAATAWRILDAAARADGIELKLVSSFRSVSYQARLIQNRLEDGIGKERVLYGMALPGYSEHHSGCALDLASDEHPEISADFRDTAAYAWLQQYAADFGFVESYPAGNSAGIMHEPWHWYYERCEQG